MSINGMIIALPTRFIRFYLFKNFSVIATIYILKFFNYIAFSYDDSLKSNYVS